MIYSVQSFVLGKYLFMRNPKMKTLQPPARFEIFVDIYLYIGNLLCNKYYYRYAIDFFEKHVDEPDFFVFVKGQEQAWLNEHEKKIVYCPENWFALNDLKITGIHSEGWVKGRIE